MGPGMINSPKITYISIDNNYLNMHIIMVVDGNGESEIIALQLAINEDKTTITHLMGIFLKNTMIPPDQLHNGR